MERTILEQFLAGHCTQAYRLFGAHKHQDGVTFTVYAPNAQAMVLLGDFNNWDGQPMRKIDDCGVWSLTVGNANEYDKYKYRILTWEQTWIEKVDPYSYFNEQRPGICSKVFDIEQFPWNDQSWMEHRTRNFDQPMNIYEVHLGSWRRKGNQEWYSYEELTSELVNYVKSMGFTHIELMPILEHPFDGSWGYQATGYYAATSRYGNPKQLMHLINTCHQHDIGVILDFVPIHFVKDEHGLASFDGGYLYEYYNERDRYSEWGTLNFDLHSETVRSFLISAANFWLDYYHIDGIRMDAISNLIFWKGNKNLGVNEGALHFVKRLNYLVHKQHPTVMMIAEDSSDYPGVTKSTLDGGLGFDYKWDLGWMNDTLGYYALDPVYRKYHHNEITFSMAYFGSERFLIPLSHDEVVHGKGTIINKIWGSYDEKFAQLRNLYTYMLTHPGKKLNFMGNEIAHFREWDEEKPMDWHLLGYTRHTSFNRFFRDLNMIYKYHEAFSSLDYGMQNGFQWIDADNAEQSIYSYYRFDQAGNFFVVILNMTPVSYQEYCIGVPKPGKYIEILNSEKDIYEGCNMCNYLPRNSFPSQYHRQEQAISICIAPFAGIIFQLDLGVEEEELPKKKMERTAKTTKSETTVKAAKKTAVKTKQEIPADTITAEAKVKKTAAKAKKESASKEVKEIKQKAAVGSKKKTTV